MAIKAKLTTFDTTMIVVSLVIGIGIFRTPAMVAAKAGPRPAVFFAAWILGGFISLLGALTFAEIGSRYARPGSFYKIVAEHYGSAPAFMLNWTNVIIVNGAGVAAVSIIGAEYLNPILLPVKLQTPTAVQLTAAALTLVLLVINWLGIKPGAWAQNILTALKVGMIGVIVIAALRHGAGPAPVAAAAPTLGPWGPALAAALISVFYTYGGYHHTINLGADVKNASRNLPRAIFLGVLIIIACYLSINFAYVRVLGLSGVAGAKLVAAETAKAVFGNFGYLFVSLGIVFSALGFLNATLMHMPRIYYAMAEDKALPPLFKKVHPRTQAQESGLLFLGGMILISIFFLGTFESIVNYVMFLDCANIAVVASTIFVLRRKAQASAASYDGYKAPLYPVLPAVFVIFLLGISLNILLTQTKEALIGTAFFATGFPFFLLMRGINKSRETDRR
jgi:basic amino acid/polyamine antiporter, APA family